MNTIKTCPLSQLYLEFGIYPARFEIMKKRILFYHYILNKNKQSYIIQVLQAQENFPVRGDWISSVKSDLKTLQIHLNQMEITNMRKDKLIHMLNKAVMKCAFEYLLNLRKSKGGEIIYKQLELAKYLQPNNSGLSISEKKNYLHILTKCI